MSGPLDNPRHEKFAQNLAKGMNQTDAYIDAYQNGEPRPGARSGARAKEPRKAASDLFRNNSDIARRVRELQDKAANLSTIMSAKELMEYLTSAVKTPVNEIDGDSEFAQEISHTERGTTVKSVSKLRSAELLCKMAGYLAPDRLEVTEIREPIAELRKRVKSAKGRHARE